MKYNDLDLADRKDLFSRALANGEIELQYQPVINSICQQITGFEALARWETKAYGKIAPAEFLPMAETCNLVDQFCAHVLQSACHAATSWQKPGQRLRLSVNVSTSQFQSDGFIDGVERALRRTGFPADLLDLEVRENALSADLDVTAERLLALDDLGVNLVIDDFGASQSPLSVLKTASFERVKIDRSFISGLGYDHADRSIVQALIDLCCSMNLYVVAVGVETPVQEDVLMELGCYEVQGFLHSRPIAKADVAAYLQVMNSVAVRRQRCA